MNGETITANGHTDTYQQAPARSVYNASSISEIRSALAELHQKESQVTLQLDALVTAQKDLQRELGRLDLFRANLSTQSARTRSISNGMLSDASATAGRISSAVRRLDLEQSRVKDTLTFVEQVRELKACVLGVSGSMGAPQDWETAAGYLNRASKLPPEVIDGEFAARIVPTAEVPDAPRMKLDSASESLCGLFLREFEKAVQENDGAKITRFFKLFPLINRADVGLDVYGRYVCSGVSARARANLGAVSSSQRQDGFFYASALTKLFEHVAQIIDGHGGLVERHYGTGRMTRVIERLQVEADLQAGIILDTWSDERRVDRQLTDIKSYAYTFLVQSFLPVPRTSAGTSRTGSPAAGLAAAAAARDDEGVDMRQVDALLNEMTNMLGKWALYTRFVSQKCSTDPDEPVKIPAFLQNSMLMRKVEEKLLKPFNTMTTFFLRRSVEKAFQLDEQPSDLSLVLNKPLNSTPPHVTSAVEDIIYIVKKVLQQSLATSQKDVITSVVPTLSRVMGSDFLGMEQRKMRDENPKTATPNAQPSEQSIVSFLVLTNNLDIAKEYIGQIIQSHLAESGAGGESSDKQQQQQQPSLKDLFPLPGDADIVSSTLRSFLSSFVDKTSMLIDEGIHIVFNTWVKPRLRPMLSDSFRDADYTLSAEEAAELARERGEYDDGDLPDMDSTRTRPPAVAGITTTTYSDQVRHRFQQAYNSLTLPLQRLMTPATYHLLLSLTIPTLAKMLEKRLWTYSNGRVTQAGAARLEHDINAVIRTIVTGQKYAFREHFLRCIQICTVMNMDEEEWEEVLSFAHSSSSVGPNTGDDNDNNNNNNLSVIADKLKPEERLRARQMVV